MSANPRGRRPTPLAHAARFVVLGGAVAGLGASPLLAIALPPLEVVAAVAAVSLGLWRARPGPGFPARSGWLAAVAAVAAAAGLCAGAARLAAIDARALAIPEGESVTVRGFVEAVPRRSHGEVRVRVATADGRLMVQAPDAAGELRVGHEVVARGTAREPDAWEAAYLARLGIASIVEASAIRPTGARRGGLAYLTDRLRERAEQALSRGTPAAESALLRGFVLGEDDRIDPATVSDYQRSGLAHLLAVSGQNVLLLALLAAPILALVGVPLRARLLCLIVLIAVYVPMAGAGASIQRAGVMGAAGVIAALASRPASRWYATALAAAATLALNPRAAGDVGWQLSFAAVIGIALWAAPLRALLAGSAPRGSPRGLLAEAAAVTVAATLATAPLMAHHFERLSLAALAANLLALPAVAPVMWLGMLAAAAGQLPWLPVEPLSGLAGLFAAYITQIAHWLAAPGWAQVEAPLAGPWAVAAIYALLAAAGWLLARRGAARRALGPRAVRRPLAVVGAGVAVAVLAAAAIGQGEGPHPPAGLEVRVLDVGQGDAILLDPLGADPVLVDTGPPGADLRARLEELGVERIAAVVVTHDQSDHAGGVGEVLAGFEVRTLGHGALAPDLLGAARAAGVRTVQLAEGSSIASGELRLDVLWPPRALVDSVPPPSPGAGADPNPLSVVIRARWRHFEMLLTADGEAEAVPLDPGPIDVLKVAHHGSVDAGLERLLGRTTPGLAVISVGEGNPFGHPAPATLATLAERGVPVVRTDSAGEVAIEVTGEGWSVGGSG